MENTVSSQEGRLSLKNRLAATLAILGVVSSLLIGAALQFEIDVLKNVGSLLAAAYSIVLIGWLVHSRSTAEEIHAFDPIMKSFKSYWVMLGLIAILTGLAFALAIMVWQNGWWTVMLSLLPAIVILVALRRQFTRITALSGIGTFVALLLVESILKPGIGNGVFMALIMTPQAMAGSLLLSHTKLTHCHLLGGQFIRALRSLGWGCVLAVPPAMLNIAMMQGHELTEFDHQFDRWWKAFFALQPGILEEIWARLFLLTLFYALLRPTSNQRPARALTAALTLSVFIHGMAHYPQSLPNLSAAIFTSMMYSIPLALIYVKRDLESAVAYHFLIDFVRFGFTASLIA